MAFLTKNKEEVLRRCLTSVTKTTPVTAIGPGSVMRALVEGISSEIGDFYSLLDYNFNQSLISSASGSALDAIGELYNVRRKTLSTIATIEAGMAAFYFYVDTPLNQGIIISAGTKVYGNDEEFVGRNFVYEVAENCFLPAGRTRVYAPLRAAFSDAPYTAGAHTLTRHTATALPEGVSLKCTNPKPVQTQRGYEDDDNYRTRIITGARVAAGGTATAVRFSALNVEGVRDAKVDAAAYGVGTFEVLVIPEMNANSPLILTAVQTAVENVRPVGVSFFVREPEKVPLTFSIAITKATRYNGSITDLKNRVEVSVLRYLNSMLVGTPFIYNHFIQRIMDTMPEAIVDVAVTKMLANGQEVLRRNYTPQPDQMIVPGSITIAISG